MEADSAVTAPKPSKRRGKKKPVRQIKDRGNTIKIYEDSEVKNGKVYRSYRLAFYRAGKRDRERQPTLAEAEERARELIDELVSGTAHIGTFDAKEHAIVAAALSKLAELPERVMLSEAIGQYVSAYNLLGGQGIVEAARFRVEYLKREAKGEELIPITFPELSKKFVISLRDRMNENKEQKSGSKERVSANKEQRGRKYINDVNSKLGFFSKRFIGQVRDITTHDIDEVLKSLTKLSGTTKNKYRSHLVTALSYARDKKHLARDKKTEAEFAMTFKQEQLPINVYLPSELFLILNSIHPRVVPFFVVGGLAGLRSSEISRLKWEDVVWGRGIFIDKEQSKTGKGRLAPILPALEAWLRPYAKEKGPVLPGLHTPAYLNSVVHDAFLAFKEKQPKVNYIANGLRHSFCSYRVAEVKSESQVAREAGNSARMLAAHYVNVKVERNGVRHIVDEKSAGDWFSIIPSAERLEELKTYAATVKA
jgi:integrase